MIQPGLALVYAGNTIKLIGDAADWEARPERDDGITPEKRNQRARRAITQARLEAERLERELESLEKQLFEEALDGD